MISSKILLFKYKITPNMFYHKSKIVFGSLKKTMLFLYFFFFLIIYAITSYFYNMLQNFPPTIFPAFPIIGHLYLLIHPHCVHTTLNKISKWLGPVFLIRLGLRHVLVISSPSAAEECLKKNDTIFANRPRNTLFGKYVGYNETTMASSPYNHHWRNLRRISSNHILTAHRLNTLSYVRADEVRMLVLQLLHLQNHNEKNPIELNMRPLFMEGTLNVMMRMIAGKRYYEDCVVATKEDVEEAETFKTMIEDSLKFSLVSSMSDHLPVLRWFGLDRKLEKSIIELHKKRDEFMQILIDQHKKVGAKHNNSTLIQVLLSLQASEPENYKDDIIKGLMLDLLVAGSETSAGTLEFALALMLNHPKVMKKAYNELVNCVGEDRLVNESDLANLPYLHCIIKETLRLFPPGPLIPHASSEEAIISGYKVPIGSMILMNIWAIQRDPNVWSEPNKFMPERFLECQGSREEGFKFLSFGSGRRACPGENLGWRMVGLNLASIIQCFEWERVSEEMVDMSVFLKGLVIFLANPLQAKCRPRSTMMGVLSHL